MAWSRGSTVRKARDSGDRPGGLYLKADATLPATSRAIQDSRGKRVGVVKRVGAKFAHSKDNYQQKFGSAQAALRQFAVRQRAAEDGDAGKAR